VTRGDYAPLRQQVQVFEELRNQASRYFLRNADLMTKDLVGAERDDQQSILVAYPKQKMAKTEMKSAGHGKRK
jgi:hypothetical protein